MRALNYIPQHRKPVRFRDEAGQTLADKLLGNLLLIETVTVRGFETCCKILLENGTDVNGINLYGIIPAQAAAVGLQLTILTLLVEYGLSKEGLNVALMNICMALSHYYEGDESAFQAKRLELARYLLEHGADPNAQDEENGDLITIATSFEENSDLVSLLLEFGAVQSVEEYLRKGPQNFTVFHG
jgi:ankyrin repeat protein